MSAFGLLQLVASATNTLLKDPDNLMVCSEELSGYYQGFDGNVKIPRVCDAVRELFLIIDLPPLLNDLFWKDDILTSLIDRIELMVNNSKITLTKNYIQKLLMENAGKLSNKTLFCNLTEEKRKKLSKKSVIITLPLKIKDLITTEPKEFYSCGAYDVSVRYNVSNNSLVEGNEDLVINDIKIGCKFIGVYHDTQYRNYVIPNYETIIQNQKFIQKI